MKLVSTKSEVAALRGACANNKVVGGTLLAGLGTDYFHNEFTRDTYKHILKVMRQEGEPPKWRDLLEDPGLSQDTRKKLKDTSTERISSTNEARAVLANLNKYRQMRGIFELSENATKTLRKSQVNVSDLIEETSAKLIQLRQSKADTESIVTFGKGNNAGKVVKSLLNKEDANFVPTGFSDYDKENGGFFFGSLVTIGATSGGGKSATASQLAINWAGMGEHVCIVPLEMTKEEMTGRIMANASNIDVRKILLKKLSEEEERKYLKSYRKMALRFKRADGAYSIFKPQSDMTIEEIMASVYTLDPSIIIIDYISLLKGVDGDDAWQKLGAVARYCKVYAEVHNKIVVLLAQVSEEGKIRYAQAIKEHSNNCWVFVSTKQTRENEIINVEQLKARNGRLFDFTLSAKLDVMRIGDLDVEEREKYSQDQQQQDDEKKERKAGKKGKNKRDKKERDAERDDRKDKANKKARSNYLSDMADGDDDD